MDGGDRRGWVSILVREETGIHQAGRKSLLLASA